MRKWAAAFILAVWHLRRAHPVVIWSRGRAMLRLLVSGLFGKTDAILGARRYAKCEHCIMFNSFRLTCGTAGEFDFNPQTNHNEPRGCWCYMPVACAIVAKDCWARANGMQFGWPKALRPPSK